MQNNTELGIDTNDKQFPEHFCEVLNIILKEEDATDIRISGALSKFIHDLVGKLIQSSSKRAEKDFRLLSALYMNSDLEGRIVFARSVLEWTTKQAKSIDISMMAW